jgi:hypothetical protein
MGVGHKDNITRWVVDNIAAKTRDLWLRWAALLRVAKPVTKSLMGLMAGPFMVHEVVSWKMVPKFCQTETAIK